MTSFRMRKFLARVFILPITIWLSVLPSNSYAAAAPQRMYPIGSTYYTPTQLAGGALSLASMVPLGNNALQVGMDMGALAMEALVNGLPKGQVVVAPGSLVKPVGFAPPASASPITTTGVIEFVNWGPTMGCNSTPVGPYTGTDPAALCEMFRGTGGNCATAPAGYYLAGGSFYCPNLGTTWSPQTITSCPSGYTGTPCVLTDPNAVKYPAGTPPVYIPQNGTLVPDPRNSSAPIDGFNPAFQYGINPVTGSPASLEVLVNPDGSVTIVTKNEFNSPTGTQTKVVTTTLNPSGQVIGSGQKTIPTDLYSLTTNPSAAPSAGVQFPNDYARQGEADAAAKVITPKLDKLHDDLTKTDTVADPTDLTAGDMPTWSNTFTDLLRWQLPAHSSACPRPSMDLSAIFGPGSIFTLQSHCDLLNNNAAPLHSAMLIVFTLSALFIVLRA